METERQDIPPSTNMETQDLPQEESTASNGTSLEDDWAAAFAEQNQAETAHERSQSSEPENAAEGLADADEQTAIEAFDSATTHEEPSQNEQPSLEDEWAAALAEQNQAEANPDQAEAAASSDEANTSTAPSSPIVDETTKSPPPANAEDLENDWAEVLEEQAQEILPDHSQPTTQHAETSPAEIEPASTGSDEVMMNWPNADASHPQQDPAPTEWEPTRLTPDAQHDTAATSTSQEESVVATTATSASSENSESPHQLEEAPPPELSIATDAAEASIHAAMEGATHVSAIIQNELANERLEVSDLESQQSLAKPPLDSTSSETPVESGIAPETQAPAHASQHPEPPVPDASPENIGQAPDRFRRPFFTGTGGSLFGMFTMNTLLTLLTFGVYSFWGRIKIRRYLYSQTRFAGARLAFHGTGGELFKGWMKAVVVFGLPYSALNYAGAMQTDATFQWSVNILAGLLILCFIPIAIIGSHRYRMSRTSWRGIYFSFRNSAKEFLTLYLKGTLFSILTLGIYYPIFDRAKRAFLVSGSYFGNRAFGFDGEAKELGTIYFKAFRLLILALVTAEAVLLATSFLSNQADPTHVIDIVFWATVAMVSLMIPFIIGLWFWFQATRQRYLWSHTTFGSARFRATMTGKELFELKLTNLLLLVFTLGLAWPWVQVRNLQFLYYHVGLQGPLNLKQVVQEAGTASPMGEELAGFFDTGFDLG